MILWFTALFLLVALGIVGYYQGAIRVAFSLIALLLAAVLAGPLAFVFKGILPVFGFKHPVVLAFVAPALMFMLILIIFKSVALVVHKKVDTHYKYHDSDTRRLLFERLNQRLGICLGLANAVVYVFLLSTVASVMGYLTTQVASSEKDGLAIRWCNRVAEALEKTGMDKAVAPFHPASEMYFDAVDILGNIYHNPLLQNRLSTYPVFLSLAEKPEFKALGSDLKFQEFWQSEPTVNELINHEKVQPLIADVDLYTNLVAMLGGNLKDLKGYIETGKSEKYDAEKILGHWDFDYPAAVALARKTTPNMGSARDRVMRNALSRLRRAQFTATIDSKATLKIPSTNNNTITLTGTWKNMESKYALQLGGGGKKIEADARIEGQKKLIFYQDSFGLVFEK